MSSTSDTSTTSIRARRPRAGTRTRGAVDALQARIAISLQDLEPATVDTILGGLVDDIPEAAGTDAAAIVLINDDGTRFQTVYAARNGFSQARVEALEDEALADWPWLADRLGHLRVVEIGDTATATARAADELIRLNELHVGSILMTGFAVNDEIAGFVAVSNDGPTENWDASLNLLIKLFAASLATGLGRLADKRRLEDYDERNDLLAETANDGVWDFDALNKRLSLSPRWRRMLGYPNDDSYLSLDWYQLVHPDDMMRVQASMRQHLEGKTPFFESTHRMKHQNGEWRWMTSRAKAIVDDRGRLIRIVGAEADITERKIYEDALFREKESAQITLQSIGDGVITTDAECNVEYINPVAEELTGWKVDDGSGRPIDEIFRAFHEETCEPLENPMGVAINRDRRIKSVRPTLLIRRDGNELYIESTASPIRDGKGRVTGGVLVFHDVSEARELNRRLSYHASHDILTGLVNRREFEARLERALKSAKARETSYALLYLDLDQFKIVNDSCGHSAGDALLGQLGALLKSKIRWRDTLA